MKNQRWLTGALILALGAAARAAETKDPAPAAGAETAPAAADAPAYLGLMTAPVPDALRHQVDLKTEAGVLVAQVDPDGAVNSVMEPFDILLKLDDQWIWNQDQLQGLMRMRKPGDTVELSFMRKGETRTVKVTVKARAPIPADLLIPQRLHLPHAGFEPLPMPLPDPFPGRPLPMRVVPGAGGTMHTETHVSFFVNEQDDHGWYALRMNDGRQTFTVKDPDGNLIFEGPVNTDPEREKVPAEFQPQLRALQSRAPRTEIQRLTVPGGQVIRIQPGAPDPDAEAEPAPTEPEGEEDVGAPM